MRAAAKLLALPAMMFAISTGAANVAHAQSDPAIATIDGLDKALIETMKLGDAQGIKGRIHRLEPTVERTFDLAAMTRFAVGPAWLKFSDAEIVQTHLIPPHDAPVALTYRMRQSGGTWKVIDVFYQGTISQLTTRRSDLAATANTGGAAALVAKLNAQSDKLMR